MSSVKIVDLSYLTKSFIDKTSGYTGLLSDIVNQFSLNAEQEQAFSIVTNHALSKSSDQLKMYMGGMGGTGKSQVIHALTKCFAEIRKVSEFLVLAPTGTSAANVDGQMYHSALGIYDNGVITSRSIFLIKEKLLGVKYIFVDKVSIMSCHDMYKISAQLAKGFNKSELPFGGVNMIFARNFTQLPFVLSGESRALYSGIIGNRTSSNLTHHDQKSAIGKALWHQVTTVVILYKNMQQTAQTVEDSRFWTALDNMRYKSCTIEDIDCLHTRIVGPLETQPLLKSKQFRDVSIITAWNSQKNRINELECDQFAKDTKQYHSFLMIYVLLILNIPSIQRSL